MTTTAIRDRLHGYINEADDQQIKAIYEIFEDQLSPAIDWSDDEEFVAELNERVRRWEEGIDRGIPIDEVKMKLEQMRKERSADFKK
jgi:hypothetical protein